MVLGVLPLLAFNEDLLEDSTVLAYVLDAGP